MYTYVTATVLSRTPGSPWTSADIADKALHAVFADFLRVYLTVKDSFREDRDIYVDLGAYRTELANSPMTVNEWLLSMVGRPLVTVEKLPTEDLVSAQYANAVMTGYKIQLGKMGYPSPEEMPVTALHDLRLTRPGMPTNMGLLHTDCLLSVNGYFHRSDYDGTSAFILDGGITAAMKRCSHTGILSFLGMGGLKTYQFRDEDIQPLTEGAPLKEGIVLTMPADLNGKSILMILGGYLIQEEAGVFYQNGDNTWVLNIKGLPYYERYLESKDEIDLTSLPVGIPDTSEEIGVVQESLLTDATLRAYLKLSQSFVAVINTPKLYMNIIALRVSQLPGLITAYQDPVYPLFMGYGKKVEFSKKKDRVKTFGKVPYYWAVLVADAWYKQFAFQTGYDPQQTVISSQLIPYRLYLRTQGYMLEMRGAKVTEV